MGLNSLFDFSDVPDLVIAWPCEPDRCDRQRHKGLAPRGAYALWSTAEVLADNSERASRAPEPVEFLSSGARSTGSTTSPLSPAASGRQLGSPDLRLPSPTSPQVSRAVISSSRALAKK